MQVRIADSFASTGSAVPARPAGAAHGGTFRWWPSLHNTGGVLRRKPLLHESWRIEHAQRKRISADDRGVSGHRYRAQGPQRSLCHLQPLMRGPIQAKLVGVQPHALRVARCRVLALHVTLYLVAGARRRNACLGRRNRPGIFPGAPVDGPIARATASAACRARWAEPRAGTRLLSLPGPPMW